ncbi:MAG: LysR family transcriptional regulator [Methylobacteriaceae bacterium]|nr:LysR family transcriptional regulator [Methylobacteriaceae bacterium]
MDRLDTYAIFAAVAERASFAAAARHLKRTPASVTRAVAALEAELGVRLLNRNTRAVSLTEAGERHLGVVRRLLADHAELRDLGADAGGAASGTLRVTAPAHFGRLHVVPLVAEFLKHHGGLRADLLLLDRVVSLVEEGIDVGVRLGPLPDSTLRAVRAGTLRFGVYASPGYLAEAGAPGSWDDLADRDVVSSLTVTPVPERWRVEVDGRPRQIAVRPRLVVNTTDAAAEAAAAGLGLVRLVSYQADALVRAGKLVALDLPETHRIPIHLVQPGGAYIPAKVRLFVAEVGRGLRAAFSG